MDDARAMTHPERLLTDLELLRQTDAPLGGRTWYGIGGSADVLAHPQSIEQLQTMMQRCHEHAVPLHVLGEGANLLVTDGGVRGIVVRLDADVFKQTHRQGDHLTAAAGCDLRKLILANAREGLGGLETLTGIPASVGGALRMNAGGRFGAIGDHVHEVLTLDAAGRLKSHARGALHFGYRETNITEPIIISATFALTEGDPTALRERVKEIYAYKKSSQPMRDASAGCAFKNPPADITEKGAGQLIDEAGLKGFRIGGAEVSQRHANFIVVHPGGSADDVLRLIRAITRRVHESIGVRLQREVVVWGEEPNAPDEPHVNRPADTPSPDPTNRRSPS